MKLNLVFLPATEPGDATFGAAPERLASYPSAAIHQIRFPTMVWYNGAVRADAIAWLRALNLNSFILVGFSKSGLGAWNIARAMPECVAGTLIFDAPVARETLPPWGTAPFYASDAAWQEDLPLRSVKDFQAVMPKSHALVLISGANFHDEMSALSHALWNVGAAHVFLPRPDLRHHWASGWIEEGLKAMRISPD